MKKILLTHLILFLSLGKLQAQKFVLEGEIVNSYQGKIYLLYGNKIDSTEVQNQRFSFTGKVAFPVKANLSTSKNNRSTGLFFLENSTLSANIAIENNRHIHFRSLAGSKSVEEIKSIMLLKNKLKKEPNLSNLLYSRFAEIVKRNPKSQIHAMILTEILIEKNLSYVQAKNLLQMMDTKTQDPQDITRINTLLTSLEQTQIGAIFPDVEFPNAKKEQLSLQANLKRFTLVSFGATDCVGCIELDRRTAEIYKEFKDKGFSVYEIFLEQDNEIWLAHLEKEKIKWNSVIALKKYNNPLIKSLGITSLPANFLLDDKGKIIAINVSPNLLYRKLEQLLGK